MSLLPKLPKKFRGVPALPGCPLTKGVCPEHGFVHGKEAEELRRGIERIMGDLDVSAQSRLQALLDRIDARDSLGYLEAKERR